MSVRIKSSHSFIVLSVFSIASHLFTTITTAFPASCAYPATRLSCSINPLEASITIKQTSLRSIALKARRTLYFSVVSYTLPRLRIPAVSITTYFCPSLVNSVSIASRVVPAISLTITRSSPRSAFVNEDFPTFGRPIKQNFVTSSSYSIPFFSGMFNTI